MNFAKFLRKTLFFQNISGGLLLQILPWSFELMVFNKSQGGQVHPEYIELSNDDRNKNALLEKYCPSDIFARKIFLQQEIVSIKIKI